MKHFNFKKVPFRNSFIGLLVLLSSCSNSYITRYDQDKIFKNMGASKVNYILDATPYKNTFSFSGVSYETFTYKCLVENQQVLRSVWGGISAPGSTASDEKRYIDIYVYLFREDQLLYWGLIDDFAKCDNEEIESLAPILYKNHSEYIKTIRRLER